MSQSRSVLSRPRPPQVERALHLARDWCQGRIIDDAPALRHAVAVARTLLHHAPDAPPEVVAAVLLHDSPEFAPDGVDLDALLMAEVGAGVAPLVRALEAEHLAMDAGQPPVAPDDRWVRLVSAADKIVAFRSLMDRARRSGDERAFWARRRGLRRVMPYFRGWVEQVVPSVPARMAVDLEAALAALDAAVHAEVGA